MNNLVVSVGCQVKLKREYFGKKEDDEKEYLIVDEIDPSKLGMQMSQKGPIWELIKLKPEGFSGEIELPIGKVKITILKISIPSKDITELIEEKKDIETSKNGKTQDKPSQIEIKREIPVVISNPALNDSHLKAWVEEMESRFIIIGGNKYPYRKYFNHSGVKTDAILALMKELLSKENNQYPHADMWKSEILNVIYTLIEKGFGDINFLDDEKISNKGYYRNTVFSLAIEKGMTRIINLLLKRPDLDINRCYIQLDSERREIKTHPFEKILLNPDSFETMISNGTYTLLFSNRNIQISLALWQKLFLLVADTVDNAKNKGKENYSSMLKTLNAILNNPRFTEQLNAYKQNGIVKKKEYEQLIDRVEKVREKV